LKRDFYPYYVSDICGNSIKGWNKICPTFLANRVDVLDRVKEPRPPCDGKCVMVAEETYSHEIPRTATLHDMRDAAEITRPPIPNVLSETTFLRYWRDIYPNVKTRACKQVLSKCHVCELEKAEMARCGNDHEKLRELQHVRRHHGSLISSEKGRYHEVRDKARADFPYEDTMSYVGDGCAQSHTTMEYKPGFEPPDKACTLKIQGTIIHGFGKFLLRAYPHIKHGANLAVHALAVAIDSRLKYAEETNTPFPYNLHVLMDGGPENSNATFFAFAEYLSTFVFEKVTLYRLPVGHTHEDIDGMFGDIWERCRREFIGTPEDVKRLYEEAIKTTLHPKEEAHLYDAFVVPDYDKFFGVKKN